MYSTCTVPDIDDNHLRDRAMIDTIDYSALDIIRGLQREGQPDVLHRIVELFCESAPRLIENMRAGVVAQDYNAIGVAAHTLKSSAAHLGLHGVYQRCTNIENNARSGNSPEIDTWVAELVAMYPHAEQALRLAAGTAASAK